MAYCDSEDVRLICGVASNIINSGDIGGLITLSDAQINDDLGSLGDSPPTRITHLSALLTAIQIYSRPDLRDRLGQVDIDEQQIEKNLERWHREVKRIYAYYGTKPVEDPNLFRVVQS